jgi:hypothetical protein
VVRYFSSVHKGVGISRTIYSLVTGLQLKSDGNMKIAAGNRQVTVGNEEVTGVVHVKT